MVSTSTELGELLALLGEVGARFEREVPLLEARVIQGEVGFLGQLVRQFLPVLKYLDRPVVLERAGYPVTVAKDLRAIFLVRLKEKWFDKHNCYVGRQLLLTRRGVFLDGVLRERIPGARPHGMVELVPREISPVEAIELYGLAEIVSGFTKAVESTIRQKKNHLMSLEGRLDRLDKARVALEA